MEKTWSIVADKLGSHLHVTVRRGVEGSRAMMGRMNFDLSDVEDARNIVHQVSDVVVARAVSYTLEELQKRGLFTTVAQAAMTEHQMEIVDIVKSKCRELALKQVIHRFGIRVNLAG